MTAARQVRFWLLGFVLFLVALYLLSAILLPFVAAMAVAYFLDPIVDRVEKAGLSRTLATTVVTAAFAILVIVALLLLVPLLHGQIVDLAEKLPGYLDALRARVLPLLQEIERRVPSEGIGQAREALSGQAGSILGWIGQAVGGVVIGGLALVNVLSLIIITPIVAFYLLRDWDQMVERIDAWLPRGQAAVIREQARLIDRTLAGWVRGQATVCLLLGAFYGIALSIVGLDFGLAVGLMAGLLSFVPFVGTITGFVAGLGIAFAQFSDWGPIVAVLAVFVVGQMIEGNFLTPKLVGDRVGLHPVWVMFALLAGGALFGFLGVLLALPVAAVIGVLVRFALSRYLASRYYSHGEPQDEPSAVPVDAESGDAEPGDAPPPAS
jgi:predicted PurR-regulated permease PerM